MLGILIVPLGKDRAEVGADGARESDGVSWIGVFGMRISLRFLMAGVAVLVFAGASGCSSGGCADDDCAPPACKVGTSRCINRDTVETCEMGGWGTSLTQCAANDTCVATGTRADCVPFSRDDGGADATAAVHP
jgi:hypothetical protein